jgi:hypothetical protein
VREAFFHFQLPDSSFRRALHSTPCAADPSASSPVRRSLSARHGLLRCCSEHPKCRFRMPRAQPCTP